VRVVTICGSLRAESSNAALLRAVTALMPEGVEVVPFGGMGELPHFNPDLDDVGAAPPPEVARLRALLIGADGIVVSTPEYAHGLPGSFKNMLDWLVSTGELVDKPVAVLNASPSGAQYAQASLVEILRTMNWRLIDEASLLRPFLPRKLAGDLPDDAKSALREAIHAFVAAIRKY